VTRQTGERPLRIIRIDIAMNAVGPRAGLAAAYAQLGRPEEARKEAAAVLRIYSGFTIEVETYFALEGPEGCRAPYRGPAQGGAASKLQNP
jgi:hypothetical protein